MLLNASEALQMYISETKSPAGLTGRMQGSSGSHAWFYVVYQKEKSLKVNRNSYEAKHEENIHKTQLNNSVLKQYH